jgi:hypothetical protein
MRQKEKTRWHLVGVVMGHGPNASFTIQLGLFKIE